MIRFVFLIMIGLCIVPVVAAGDFRNLQCACVGSKTPSHKDKLEIQKAFPADSSILRFIFKDQTYYVMTRHRKIIRVLSGWETGQNADHVWAVMDSRGMLLEWLVFPANQRIDMRVEKQSMVFGGEESVEVYPEVVHQLRQQLCDRWPAFMKQVRLNLYKNDTISQATP